MQVKIQMTDDTFHINTVRRIRYISNAQAFGDNERDIAIGNMLLDYKNDMAVRPTVQEIHATVVANPNLAKLSSCEFLTSEGYCFLFMVNKNLLMIDVATELKTLTLSYIGTHDGLGAMFTMIPFQANQVEKYSLITPCDIALNLQSKEELFMTLYDVALVREDNAMMNKLLECYMQKESPNAICDNNVSVHLTWLKFSKEFPKLAEQLDFARLEYTNARQTLGRLKALVLNCKN